MARQIDTSTDQEIGEYIGLGGTYHLVVTLHKESATDTKVRYFIKTTYEDAHITSLHDLPRTKDGGYLVVDQPIAAFDAENALRTLRDAHKILFSPTVAETVEYDFRNVQRKEKRKKDILLGQYKTTDGFFELSVIARVENGVDSVGCYVRPLNERAENLPVMQVLERFPEKESFGFELRPPVRTNEITEERMAGILNLSGINFNGRLYEAVYAEIDKWRQRMNEGRKEKEETDFSKSRVIGTYPSADGKYELIVKLATIENPSLRKELPYFLHYYAKPVDGQAERTLQEKLNDRSFHVKSEGAYFLHNHSVRPKDMHLPRKFLEQFKQKYDLDFTGTTAQNDIELFCETYLRSSFAENLKKMPPKPRER